MTWLTKRARDTEGGTSFISAKRLWSRTVSLDRPRPDGWLFVSRITLSHRAALRLQEQTCLKYPTCIFASVRVDRVQAINTPWLPADKPVLISYSRTQWELMFLKNPVAITTCSHIKNGDKQEISIPLAISPASGTLSQTQGQILHNLWIK